MGGSRQMFQKVILLSICSQRVRSYLHLNLLRDSSPGQQNNLHWTHLHLEHNLTTNSINLSAALGNSHQFANFGPHVRSYGIASIFAVGIQFTVLQSGASKKSRETLITQSYIPGRFINSS